MQARVLARPGDACARHRPPSRLARLVRASSTCAAILALGFVFTGADAGAKPLGPCSLVTAKEMQAITHLQVAKEVLAPLGPTCIYTFRKSRTEITVAVETRSFSTVVRQMTAPKRVLVRHLKGDCGKVGLPTLFVSLPHKQVLEIAAGCTVAQKIAAIALARLKL